MAQACEERRATLHVIGATNASQEEGMTLKPLIAVGAVLFAASAFAQGTQGDQKQQPQTPPNNQPNAQGERAAPGKTMQEKDIGLMNQSGGAPGATGSTGTQSGGTPNTGAGGTTGTTK
jgi:hypothetical protein